MNTLKKQWFTIAIFIAILLAYLLSKTALTIPADYATGIKFSLIIAIFLLSGLTIETQKLAASLKNWRLHLTIQMISFIVFPIVIICAALITGKADLSNFIYLGFVVLACIPTTISSCVVFTRNAGGNTEAALFNATLGNLLGIIITPFLIFLFIGQSIELDPVSVIKKLCMLVVVPFVIGQICKNMLAVSINTNLAKIGGNWLMLGIMLLAFMSAFQQGIDINITEFIIILLLCGLLKILLTSLTWYTSFKADKYFDLADRKCLTITATQKTLALGLPIITVLFAGNPNMALISLPVIAYHTIQLIIDGVLVGRMEQMR